MRASKQYSLQTMISQNLIGHGIAKDYRKLQKAGTVCCCKKIYTRSMNGIRSGNWSLMPRNVT
ncbi:hypothetical protein E2C01_075637 [Portunus trituberculatus]|uniref:Uncharacterized protein n=1 Tax=Portunus trituberculatus TaxID=210409 RepID=A0A5B7IHK5_PORTR|nr:hypothetical protein [Portunus trituberculatus]